jgi:hypothetical protein
MIWQCPTWTQRQPDSARHDEMYTGPNQPMYEVTCVHCEILRGCPVTRWPLLRGW